MNSYEHFESERLHRLQLLDKVFNAFITTNLYKKKHYDLSEILQSDHYHTRYYWIEYNNKVYTAEVSLKDCPTRKDCLNIKLFCSNFQKYDYSCVHVENRPAFNNKNDWEKLSADSNPELGCLFSLFKKSDFQLLKAYLNITKECLAIQLFSRISNVNNVLITLEDGEPEYLEKL